MQLEHTVTVRYEDGSTGQFLIPITVTTGQEFNVSITFERVEAPPSIVQPITCDAVFQHHWWEAEVKPIRVGPSVEHWDLHIRWRRDKPLMNWVMQGNLMAVDETPAIFRWCEDHAWLNKGKRKIEYIPPGRPGNPTKDTPAYVEAIDWGKIRIYESSDVFMKFDIMFKKLRGHFVAIRRDPRLNLWLIRREAERPQTKLAEWSEVEDYAE